MSTIKIAIDGPAGAGKSTIAKIVAKQLGFIYIDTGAMYRAVALKAIKNNIDTKDTDKVCSILHDLDIDIKYDNNGQVVFLDGQDVTQEIRTPEVSIGASNVAAIPEVRIKLVELQRKLAASNNVIMDGRDIGTYVLPDADIKIFLTASVEDRAKRRYEEMIAKNSFCSLEEVKKDIEYRDKNDSSRAFAPLKIAEDAVVIDTTGNELEESLNIVLQLIKERLQ
ncbi:MAG: CMP/dCMP kinase [Petroclostridium sp.]|jgi:cytidylate kinase|uniref:(d)CMP kinase n=1 Tax=Petroclostridium xylanilyticum TaxID=1792311 RepID=UPI000B98D7E1|nr:(d)CMP kinase [Petroclostridium xylanilyticum]MBZ4645774.1 cytidylate kinase [Clostridia bacterium]MDK2810902.1 CMP/dCMP kinase [Petroclostridium sp.]